MSLESRAVLVQDQHTLDELDAWLDEMERERPQMRCSMTFFRPARERFEMFIYEGATIYVGEEDDAIAAYAIVVPSGSIKWLLARDDATLIEFMQTLIPVVVSYCGVCYGRVENVAVREAIRASRPTITIDGDLLRDETP